MIAEPTDYLAAIEALPAGARLLLTDVSWEEYESILAALGDYSHLRLAYDSGKLEVMCPSEKHEGYKGVFTHLIAVLTQELDQDFLSRGSTTLRKKRKAKGTEPDDCFYIRNYSLVAGKEEIDLSLDPPPDLAIEVDIASKSLNRFPIYVAMQVPEVWRFGGQQVRFYRLAGESYTEIQNSDAFPFLLSNLLPEFLQQGKVDGINAMTRAFREWVRANLPK